MNISIMRSAKIAVGTILILMSLNQEYIMVENGNLLALSALPFIFAGLFNWTPLAFIASRISRASALKLIAPLSKQVSA